MVRSHRVGVAMHVPVAQILTTDRRFLFQNCGNPNIPRCHPGTLPRTTSIVKHLERWPCVACVPSEGRITKSAEEPGNYGEVW